MYTTCETLQMSASSRPEASSGEQWQVGSDLEPEIRHALARCAEAELAQRSLSGALVYFALILLLAFSTPYYKDYPGLLVAAGLAMLAVGAVRTLAARRVLYRAPPPGTATGRILRGAIYATALPWGVFCAVTLHLYPVQWAAVFLLLSTAALASGATSSLAPDATVATRFLLLLVVPTILSAAMVGDPAHLALASAASIYLVFLTVQARGNGRTFWKTAVAAEWEKSRNSAERRRTEVERAMLAAAIEQSAEEIVITDEAGNIRYCNPAFERITGYARAEVLGRNPRFLNSGRQTPEFFRDMWATITQGRVWTGRFTNRRKDGSLYEAEGTISPIHDDTGRLTGFVSSRHDVTDRLRLESELRQAQKLESVGRLAGGVAHDFNNLLTVILGYSRALIEERSREDDPVHVYAREICAAGERAASLTRQLLSFSRQQIVSPRAIALDGLIQEMLPMLRRLVGEDIRVDAPIPSARMMVRADPDQMSQIFMNLAANARDAMPQGGTLTLTLEEIAGDAIPTGAPPGLASGAVVRLTVRDTGAGMDKETRQRLFEPFFTTKEHGHGTGLGLATVYGIVQQSEGFIEAVSEPGRGAAFRIYLRRVEQAQPAPKPAAAPLPAKGGPETVLVVEDQDDLRHLVSGVLEARGYRVLDASDGRSALRLVAATAEPIDLLLTDVIMPDITGKEVADEIRQARPNMRVLYMSGYPGEVIARRGVLEGGVSYLAKPFTIDALAAKVREVLDEGAPISEART